MSDDDTTDDSGIDAVSADGQIYARVTDSGIDTSAGERPDLPQIHDEVTVTDSPRTDNDLSLPADSEQWIVGQERVPNGASHRFEVWVPLDDGAVQVSTRRLQLYGEMVRNGHSNSRPYLEELFVVDQPRVERAIETTDVRRESQNQLTFRGSALQMGGSGPARSPYTDNLSFRHDWLHATDPEQGSRWEAFVPMEAASFSAANGCVVVEWTDEMILRSDGAYTDLIDDNDGLRVKNLFTVPEEEVPEADHSGEQVDADTVGRFDTNADIVGSTRFQ